MLAPIVNHWKQTFFQEHNPGSQGPARRDLYDQGRRAAALERSRRKWRTLSVHDVSTRSCGGMAGNGTNSAGLNDLKRIV
jgi:hypothetical protein